MGKLSLVLADDDTEYLSKLERFLIVNHPQRFEIISFVSRAKLDAYLDGADKPDILLVCNDMFKEGPITGNAAVTVILDGGGETPVPAGYATVEKYRHADRLVADLLRLYSSKGVREHMTPGKYRTRIICVCSPAGGTGKSSIAAGCSILCGRRGTRTFYLNLEAVPSTEAFFHSDAGSGQSFSNVIYYLKGRNGNIGLKLEGAASLDARTGVHYFKPPEKLPELNELTEQDIALLLNTFRKSAVYDMVFVDIGSGFCPVNAEVIRQSDVILPVLVPGKCASVKYGEFMNGIEYIRERQGAGHAGRIIPVFNRINGVEPRSVLPQLFGDCVQTAVINECPVSSSRGLDSALTDDAAFLSGVGNLCGHLTYDCIAASPSDGGESIAS